jgi:hypothetical protein
LGWRGEGGEGSARPAMDCRDSDRTRIGLGSPRHSAPCAGARLSGLPAQAPPGPGPGPWPPPPPPQPPPSPPQPPDFPAMPRRQRRPDTGGVCEDSRRTRGRAGRSSRRGGSAAAETLGRTLCRLGAAAATDSDSRRGGPATAAAAAAVPPPKSSAVPSADSEPPPRPVAEIAPVPRPGSRVPSGPTQSNMARCGRADGAAAAGPFGNAPPTDSEAARPAVGPASRARASRAAAAAAASRGLPGSPASDSESEGGVGPCGGNMGPGPIPYRWSPAMCAGPP